MTDGPAASPALPPTDALASVVLDPGGRILGEIVCRGCGYSVRGLRPADDCPECTTPVVRSLRGDALRFAPPDWLARLRLGCRLYVIGGVTTLVLIGVMIVVSTIVGATAARGGPTASVLSKVQLALALLGVTTAAVSVLGAWFLTTPEPASSGDSGLTLRTAARAGLIAHLISSPTQLYWSSPGTVAVLGMAAGLVAVGGWVLYFLHLRRLARRVPAPRLAWQLRVLAIGFGISATIMAGVGLVALLLAIPTTSPSVMMIIGIASCGAFPVYFGCEIWGIVLHAVLSARLRACLASTAAG